MVSGLQHIEDLAKLLGRREVHLIDYWKKEEGDRIDELWRQTKRADVRRSIGVVQSDMPG